jgi:hypothetical protein
LLQGVLNSIDGALVRGENYNAFYDLFRFWRHIGDARTEFDTATTPDFAWFGAPELPDEPLLDGLRRVARQILLGDEVDDGRITCLGFKEIRYGEVGDDLSAYLDFLQVLLPNAAIIINVRDHGEVAKSAWWRSRPEADVRQELTSIERHLIEYAEGRTNSFNIGYDEVVAAAPALEELFAFLGAPWDLERIDAVLAVRHSSLSKGSDERKRVKALATLEKLESEARHDEALAHALDSAVRWPDDATIAAAASRHLIAFGRFSEARVTLDLVPDDARESEISKRAYRELKRSQALAAQA